MRWFALTLLLTIMTALDTQAQRDSLTIAFYNCENYFDSFRDSSINDAEYTYSGKRYWSYSRFLAKRNGIYKVLASMSNPGPPEIIGVCEVENRFVLNQLAYKTPLSKHEYAVVHDNSSDRRGIDVGLLYQRNRLRLLTERYFNPIDVDTSLRTRSILYAIFRWGELDTLHLFVSHFPSKLGGGKSDRNRLLVANLLKSKIDSVKAKIPGAIIVVMGDFNDTPVSSSVAVLEEAGLVNLSLPLFKQGKGTIRYNGEWELIDQILVSPALYNRDTPVWLKGEMRIHSVPFMLEEDSDYGGVKPKRTYNGYRYNEGYSDHLPIAIDLIRVL